MRKLVYSTSLSLDGYIDSAARDPSWVVPDEELHRHFNDVEREIDTLLYGRRMYEIMAGYWPTADQDPSAPGVIVEYAQIWKPVPKVVFSSTLERVDWNSRLIRGDAVAEVARLKAQPGGGSIGVGGLLLASALASAGLIDEYRLYYVPILLGSGQAAINVARGERYQHVIDEVILFAQGVYGEDSGFTWMNQDLKDRLVGTQRARELAQRRRVDTPLAELRATYGGAGVSDEEFLLRYIMKGSQEIDTMRAAGPPKKYIGYAGAAMPLARLLDELDRHRSVRFVSVRRGDSMLELRRQAANWPLESRPLTAPAHRFGLEPAAMATTANFLILRPPADTNRHFAALRPRSLDIGQWATALRPPSSEGIFPPRAPLFQGA